MNSRKTWNDSYVYEAHRLAMEGHTDTKIASHLGIHQATWSRWLQERPLLREAIDEGRKIFTKREADAPESFEKYVYDRLPEHLIDLWDEIVAVEKHGNSLAQLEKLLYKAGVKARQHLFMYALVNCSFNPSQACRLVNISKSLLDKWIQDDPEFAELVDEIHWHKKNFAEGCLLKAVQRGEPSILWNVNKTLNADRGYAEKKQMSLDIQGEVDHKHSIVSVEELDALPLATRLEVLRALRDKKKEVTVPSLPGVQNAEKSTPLA